MSNSVFNSLTIVPDAVSEVTPKSSLPWVWFGFLFVAAFIIEETLMVTIELDSVVSRSVINLLWLAGWIYWLFCVNRFHRILREISRNQYPITSAEAVWKHFLPFYNLFWIFHWPNAMSDYLNRRGRVTMVSGNILGVFLLLSALVGRFFDTGVGLAGTFVVGMYISAKLRAHVEQIASRDQLPPEPDPSLFRQSPLSDNQATLSTNSPTSFPSQSAN
jgi:hypothetical protein